MTCSAVWYKKEYYDDTKEFPVMVEHICIKEATDREKYTGAVFCEDHKFLDMDEKHAESGSSNPDYNQEDYIDQFEELVGESNEERI